jgi:hypothetical protein
MGLGRRDPQRRIRTFLPPAVTTSECATTVINGDSYRVWRVKIDNPSGTNVHVTAIACCAAQQKRTAGTRIRP